jgi:hypothetical protein
MARGRSRTAPLTLEFAQAAVEQEGDRRHQAAEEQTLDAHLHDQSIVPALEEQVKAESTSPEEEPQWAYNARMIRPASLLGGAVNAYSISTTACAWCATTPRTATTTTPCVVAGPAMVPLILAVLAGHRLGGYH